MGQQDLQRGVRAIAWALAKGWVRLQFPTVARLSTDELAVWLEQPQDKLPQNKLQDKPQNKPLLLDARSEVEFAVSHLRNARLATLPQPIDPNTPPNTPIVVYCSIGYRSARLAEKLQSQGYRNVHNLEGSIFQWVNEGRSIYRGDRLVQQVHPYNSQWGMLIENPDSKASTAQTTP